MTSETPLLVVDANEGMRLLLGIAGHTCGYEVTTAASAEAAMGILHADRRVAAVISDVELPGLDGLELLRWSKRTSPHRPFVLVAGRVTPELEREAAAAGADAVVRQRLLVERFGAVVDGVFLPLAA
jgi:two-component system sensor histidine kinase/response regulator